MKFLAGSFFLLTTSIFFVEGSFLRDVVGRANNKNKIESELLAKAIPFNDYRAQLNSQGLDIDDSKLRYLEQNNGDAENLSYYGDINFDGYSLKYGMCQPVQRLSEDAIFAGEYTPMVVDDIVVLRLCPSDSCTTKKTLGCSRDFVDYAVSVSDYIGIMLLHKLDRKEQLCNWCTQCAGRRKLEDANGNNDQAEDADANQDQENDVNDEQNQDNEAVENDGEQNYNDAGDDALNGNDDQQQEDNAVGDDVAADTDDAVGDDAANQEQGDDGKNEWDEMVDDAYYAGDDGQVNECEDYSAYCFSDGVSVCEDEQNEDEGNYLDFEGYLNYLDCQEVNGNYIRPRCNGYDQTISMGVYYDQFCSQYAGDKINMNSLGLGIQPYAFKEFYADTPCVDCTVSEVAPYYAVDAYMCNVMHASAAHCSTNLKNDIFNASSSSSAIENSASCNFIKAIQKGTYDEEGRVYGSVASTSFNRHTTEGQKVALILSLILCALMALYSCYLHHSITNLLIRSISHTELLPSSRKNRHSQHSRRRNGKDDANGSNSDDSEDWHHVSKVSRARSSRSNRRSNR